MRTRSRRCASCSRPGREARGVGRSRSCARGGCGARGVPAAAAPAGGGLRDGEGGARLDAASPLSSSSEALRCSTSAGESLARRRRLPRRPASPASPHRRHHPAAPAAPPAPPHGLAHGRRYRDAYEAFRALHRLDRDWPFLLEWLVRSKAHWLREAGHLASRGPCRASSADRRPRLARRRPRSGRRGERRAGEARRAARRGRNRRTRWRRRRSARGEPTPMTTTIATTRLPSVPRATATLLCTQAGDPDHYACIGVTHDATADELRRAYRKVSLASHDKPGGSEEAFSRVSAAYKGACTPLVLACRRNPKPHL